LEAGAGLTGRIVTATSREVCASEAELRLRIARVLSGLSLERGNVGRACGRAVDARSRQSR
jgi:hypothetical protein